MKSIFLFIAILISLNSFSQKFTLTELISLYENNDSFFKSFVEDKGYSFFSQDKNNVTYIKDLEFNSIKLSLTFPKGGVDVPNRNVVWIFHSNPIFFAFKNELSYKSYTLNRDFSTNTNDTPTQYFIYTNNVYEVILSIKKLKGYEETVYTVILMKV